MKKEMISKVVEAMERTGFVEVELYGVTKEERLDEISEIISEEVRKIEEEKKMSLLKVILKDFQGTLENVSDIEGKMVTITSSSGERERPATYEDSIDFIQSAWIRVSEDLCEHFNIDLDEQ